MRYYILTILNLPRPVRVSYAISEVCIVYQGGVPDLCLQGWGYIRLFGSAVYSSGQLLGMYVMVRAASQCLSGLCRVLCFASQLGSKRQPTCLMVVQHV